MPSPRRSLEPDMDTGWASATEIAAAVMDGRVSATAVVEDAWRPAVRANLDVSLRLARLVDEFALPDETESASVYST